MGRLDRTATTGIRRVVIVVLAAIAGLFGRVLWRSVPFELASYAAWAGLFLALVALLSLPRPPRWLGLPTRTRALMLAGLGVAMTATALLWPSSVRLSAGASPRLDDFLPAYQFAEYHEVRTRAPLTKVLAAARQVSLDDMPAARVLMRLRALASGQLSAPAAEPESLLDMMLRPGSGFLVLDDSNPAELVLGMAGRPWRDEPPPAVSSAAEFQAFSAPGQVRVAFDIRTVDEGNGLVRVSTETRILGNDADACRVFARYWRLIYPGSAIIRQVWLQAIVARAERTS